MQSLMGATVVFTGKMQYLTRAQCRELVLLAGGIIQSNVSRYTDILVVGSFRKSQPCGISYKLERALFLSRSGYRIKIMQENEFYETLGIHHCHKALNMCRFHIFDVQD